MFFIVKEVISVKKALRIKSTRDIEAVLKGRDVVRNNHFKVYKRKNHGQRHFRVAFSVPKKYGNAVERNKMKRRLRMIVSSLNIQTPFDIFIIVNPNAKGIHYERITKEITYLLEKAKII